MPQKPVNLALMREAECDLAEALVRYPELQEANPERQRALEKWVQELDTEEHTDE